ncbi:hypothetical protein CCAX7_007930 [Capsulimonas corticalis]|uniref:Uncharacterized protein n=1 Tax=Capsulimonas corticalis TaxID=2219043 RepID=A0A402CTU9_9BACT|nr:hypothetical protein CCAX7_007930 [Capsulimonas corticalis]
MTVPVVEIPPGTTEGDIANDTSVLALAGWIIKRDVWLPLLVAVIYAEVAEATLVVFTVKLELVCPANTVVVAGTIAEGSPLDKATAVSTAGAVPRVTVPLDAFVPVTCTGLNVSEITPEGTVAGTTASCWYIDAPFRVAPMFA